MIYALILEMLDSLVLEMTDALVLEFLDSLVLELLDSLVLETLDSLVLGFLKASPRSLASFASTLFNRGLQGKNVSESFVTLVFPTYYVHILNEIVGSSLP